MSTTIKLIIADDHDVYRDGLRLLFENNPDISLIGEACNGKKLLELVKQLQPDVVLTDLLMPAMTGVQAITKISEFNADIKCIAISTFEYEQIIVEALEAGALGYLSKHANKTEIVDAIAMVYEGDPYYCKRTTSRMTKLISLSKFNPYRKKTVPLFSDTEKEIIRRICEQKTSKEIGAELFLSTRTIEKYRANILEKMKVRSIVGITIYAIKNGIVALPD